MIFIELHNLQFHAFHGVYAGERKTGGPFEVSLTVGFDEGGRSFDDLPDTINYETVLAIVKEHMHAPASLLEKVARGILLDLQKKFPFILEINISIYKLEPPIENFQGKVGVTLKFSSPSTSRS